MQKTPPTSHNIKHTQNKQNKNTLPQKTKQKNPEINTKLKTN